VDLAEADFPVEAPPKLTHHKKRRADSAGWPLFTKGKSSRAYLILRKELALNCWGQNGELSLGTAIPWAFGRPKFLNVGLLEQAAWAERETELSKPSYFQTQNSFFFFFFFFFFLQKAKSSLIFKPCVGKPHFFSNLSAPLNTLLHLTLCSTSHSPLL
jgi:hypothetical protein